jgi:hypothetical protein
VPVAIIGTFAVMVAIGFSITPARSCCRHSSWEIRRTGFC